MFLDKNSKFVLRLLKDDGELIKVAASNDRELMIKTSSAVATFLRIPVESYNQ